MVNQPISRHYGAISVHYGAALIAERNMSKLKYLVPLLGLLGLFDSAEAPL
jgi:hypothetical protein